MKIQQTIQAVQKWSESKGIDNPHKQFFKILEELGEFSAEMLSSDTDKQKMELGDIAVTVIIYYYQTKRSLSIQDLKAPNTTIQTLTSLFIRSFLDGNKYALINLDSMANRLGFTLEEALNMAWNKIRDRKGKTVDGIFIKNGECECTYPVVRSGHCAECQGDI